MVNMPCRSTRSLEDVGELVARVITKPPSRPIEVKEKPPHAPKEPKPRRFFDDDELFGRSFEDEELYARDLEARVITKPAKPVEVKEKPPHAPKEPKSKRSFLDLVARVITKPSKPIAVKEKPPHPPKEPKSKRAFDEEELLERAFDEEDLWERDLEARVITKPSKPVGPIKEKPVNPPRPRPKRSFDDELFERAFSVEGDLYGREIEYWLD